MTPSERHARNLARLAELEAEDAATAPGPCEQAAARFAEEYEAQWGCEPSWYEVMGHLSREASGTSIELTLRAVQSACERAVAKATHHLATPDVPRKTSEFRAETDLAYLVLDLLKEAPVPAMRNRNPAVLALIRGVIERHAPTECWLHATIEAADVNDLSDLESAPQTVHVLYDDNDQPIGEPPDLRTVCEGCGVPREIPWPCPDYLAAENALGVGAS
jgi:hypothetical protein